MQYYCLKHSNHVVEHVVSALLRVRDDFEELAIHGFEG